jgi:hypothetical protein
MSIVGKIKAQSSLRLYLFLLLNPDTTLSASDALEAGIRSPNSLAVARNELAELGLINLSKVGRQYIISLNRQPVEQSAETVGPAERAIEIDEMDDDGVTSRPDSSHNLKRKAAIAFLRDMFSARFTDYVKKYPLTDASIRKWLQVEPSVLRVFEMIEQVAARPGVQSPPFYILSALERSKNEQSRVFVKGGQETYMSEEEAQIHYQFDPMVKQADALRRAGKLRARRPQFQDGEGGDVV